MDEKIYIRSTQCNIWDALIILLQLPLSATDTVHGMSTLLLHQKWSNIVTGGLVVLGMGTVAERESSRPPTSVQRSNRSVPQHRQLDSLNTSPLGDSTKEFTISKRQDVPEISLPDTESTFKLEKLYSAVPAGDQEWIPLASTTDYCYCSGLPKTDETKWPSGKGYIRQISTKGIISQAQKRCGRIRNRYVP